MPVRRRTNAHGKQPLIAQLLTDLPEKRRLISHCTIGNENHLAHPRAVFSLASTFQCSGQGRRHLGTAIGPKTVNVPTGPGEVIAGRHFRLHKKRVSLAVELNHIEPVPWRQRVQTGLKGISGLADRFPAMEPEVSITNTRSRGSAMVPFSPGTSIAMR